MFEAVELNRRVSKNAFREQEPKIRIQLLDLQQLLQGAKIPVVIIVSGVEGAGKSEVVNRLNEWLDTRGIQTHAFWDETDEEQERPRFWRFWRKMPPRGTIGIMFGSWYTRPIIHRVFNRISDADLDKALARINELEHMLYQDGTLIVKIWFHLSKASQGKRVQEKYKGKKYKTLEKKFAKHYDGFASVSERAIRVTDTGECPWYLIEAENKRYRDLTAGRTLIEAMRQRLKVDRTPHDTDLTHDSLPSEEDSAKVTILDHIDLSPVLSEKEYKQQLGKYQSKLRALTWEARNKGHSCVTVFEGWDAAGKGGTIRRITAAVDARLYRVISIAAPTDEELAHHYLWRFWRHLPGSGYLIIYDRSWYGRVLVERVEGLAKDHEWMRAYQEINDFEEQLSDHGIIVSKFWMHISQEEQLKRFKEREKVAWKLYKITEEDWRNREKWDDYKHAVNDMVVRTSTAYAPWNLIAANDKKSARVQVLKTLCDRIAQML